MGKSSPVFRKNKKGKTSEPPKKIERARTPEELKTNGIGANGHGKSGGAKPHDEESAPVIQNMTAVELMMRNKDLFHPELLPPPMVINGWVELAKPVSVVRLKKNLANKTFGYLARCEEQICI